MNICKNCGKEIDFIDVDYTEEEFCCRKCAEEYEEEIDKREERDN